MSSDAGENEVSVISVRALRSRQSAPWLLLALLTACAPVDPVPTIAGSGSPVPMAAASPGGVAPTVVPSATPPSAGIVATSPPASATPAVSASPSPGSDFDLTRGTLLRAYDFKHMAGVYYEFTQNQLLVVDAANERVSPYNYVLRKFEADGRFNSVVTLAPEGSKDPDTVDGMAFDRYGTPFYTYREDEKFQLLKSFNGTVKKADRIPSQSLPRAGLAALSADKDVISLAVYQLDEKKLSSERQLVYVRAEENETPLAIFKIPDPFTPTAQMAFGPNGALIMVGGVGGRLGVKRLEADQTITDLPVALDTLPSGMWVSPAGEIVMAFDTKGATPAKLRRFGMDGSPRGETEARLKGGGVLYRISGLTYNAKGQVIMAASGIDGAGIGLTGLFTFD